MGRKLVEVAKHTTEGTTRKATVQIERFFLTGEKGKEWYEI